VVVSAAATLHGSRALWYLTRGSGIVAMVLLTIGVVLGVVTTLRVTAPGWPRFLLAELHRNVSFLVLAVLVVHIAAAVLDTFAPIGLLDAVVPLHSSYRPFWLGLGAVAFDLVLVAIISSVVRASVGYKRWRALHWTVYPAWAAAVVHGLGTGSDTQTSWVLLITVLCVLAVIAALAWRLASGWPEHQPVRLAAGGLTVVALILVASWTRSGPLRTGWARAAGTPAALLGSAPQSSAQSSSGGGQPPAAATDRPFSGSVSGRLTQAPADNGQVRVTLDLTVGGGVPGHLVIVIDGVPAAGGGVEETASRVNFLPQGAATRLTGTLTALDGNQLSARLSDGQRSVTIRMSVSISDSGAVTGSLDGAPA
jgi:methionine sulfoxide reductase heme-binding subunit